MGKIGILKNLGNVCKCILIGQERLWGNPQNDIITSFITTFDEMGDSITSPNINELLLLSWLEVQHYLNVKI